MADKILTLTDLVTIRSTKAIETTPNQEVHLNLGEPYRFYLARDLTYLFDSKTGIKYTMDATDVTKRALGTIPGIENPAPLSAAYMAALALNKPNLPDSVLIDPARAPKAHLRFHDASSLVTVNTITNNGLIWLMPENGIASMTNPGYYYINGFPLYVINENGEVITTDDTYVVEPNLDDKRVITLLDVNNRRQDVYLVDLMRLAFGLHTNETSSPVYFKDGDDTNVALTNLTTSFEENATLSVELQEGDEDGIANY